MKGLLILFITLLLSNVSFSQISRITDDENLNKKISFELDKFYENKTYTHQVFRNDSRIFEMFLTGQDSARLLYLRCRYFGKGWVFFKKVIWLNDRGEKIEFSFEPKELRRETGSAGYVYEIGTKQLDYKQIEDLQKFLTGALKVDMRFIGDKYNDTSFKEKRINAALDMIEFFYINNKAVDMLKELYELEQKLKNS